MTDPGPDDGLRNSFYRKTTRSSRRMTPVRRLLYALAVPLGLGIITSVITAVTMTRMMIALWYRWKRPTSIPI